MVDLPPWAGPTSAHGSRHRAVTQPQNSAQTCAEGVVTSCTRWSELSPPLLLRAAVLPLSCQSGPVTCGHPVSLPPAYSL